MKRLGVVLAVTLCATRVWAAGTVSVFTNGLELSAWCNYVNKMVHIGGDESRAQHAGYQAGMCLGYIRAVSDAIQSSVNSEAGVPALFCIPGGEGGVTSGQVVKVVIKYLEDHPQDLHKDAAGLVMNALAAAFPTPCR